ncbi:MAG TPA: gamma-glutamyltransferase [Burkholderiales bacterium]|nr:gamma-glutamyltransferase [Burkholderiales bacterium]
MAAAHPLAVQAGYDVLKRGGSALDAAIAVQMVLGLAEPSASGIGGGAFMLHWSARDRTLRTYDGRETAPAAARPDLFLEEKKRPLEFLDAVASGRSVGVPGVLRMLELAHQRHGKLPWAELFEPAISLAQNGFAASPRLRTLLEREVVLKQDPAARKIYYEPGGRIVNPEYGKTLRAIAEGGAEAFYRGPIAQDIVRAVRSHAKPGGMTEADLSQYRALERDALCGNYRVWVVCSMPPPSAGGVALLQILGVLERKGFSRAAPQSARALHLLAEAERLAYADRARHMGDADFVPVPIKPLLAGKYLDERAALIGERALTVAPPGSFESGTSHLVVADAEGNVLSMTTTIESIFGSRIMVRGFLLNNQLTDFDFVPGGPNQVQGGKRPRSSTTPVIAFDADGAVRLAAGSAGGSMIINYVAKTLVAVLDWDLDIQAAVAAPNLGNRSGPTEIEQGSAYEALAPALRARGHEVSIRELPSGSHGIERVPGGWRGGADPRRDGTAKGD